MKWPSLNNRLIWIIGMAALAVIFLPAGILANSNVEEGGTHANAIPVTFLWIAVLLMLAKASSLIERVGQPAVLGELLIGIAIGSLPLFGLHIFEPIKTNMFIHFLAELGIVILLFQLGLESNMLTMLKVGVPSFLVACVGVALPLVAITYVAAPMLVPGLSSTAYLFLGATMTATSVGITVRVLKDINKAHTTEARIIIGAAVIDDVLGLIVLAVVSGMATQGSVDAGMLTIIILKAVVFLVGGILVGKLIAPYLSAFFSKIHTGVGMKFALVISFGLFFAYLASIMGLAPIVGAFAAGLLLEDVYFKQFDTPQFVDDIRAALKGEKKNSAAASKVEEIIKTYSHKHIEQFVEHLAHFLVPIFFVLTGMQVKIDTLFNPKIIVLTVVLLIVASLTKVAAGYVAGKGLNRLAIGVGMIPRGEVGLIFANIGKGLGIMDDTIFSSMVAVVMLTTLVTPPILAIVLKKTK